MANYTEKELFESVPVPRAVATLAIPTIISQVVRLKMKSRGYPFL